MSLLVRKRGPFIINVVDNMSDSASFHHASIIDSTVRSISNHQLLMNYIAPGLRLECNRFNVMATDSLEKCVLGSRVISYIKTNFLGSVLDDLDGPVFDQRSKVKRKDERLEGMRWKSVIAQIRNNASLKIVLPISLNLFFSYVFYSPANLYLSLCRPCSRVRPFGVCVYHWWVRSRCDQMKYSTCG